MNRSLKISSLSALALLVAGLTLACGAPAAGQSVLINELLASNSKNMADPQGEYDDWIELYNPDDAPIEAGGMYLTDDLAVPTKWQLPTGGPIPTTIPPHGYLLIWADNQVTDPGLHAAFKLSADGETVGLFDRDGVTLIDSVTFGPQRADVSCGRVPDGNDVWSFLTIPTPGGPNFRIYQGFVDKPEVTPERGFYDQEILVAMACRTEGAMIYFTTDGSEPYSQQRMRPSSTAALYSAPIRISKTTCLRATAFKMGWQASPTETNTYIFVKDVVNQSPSGARPGSAWPSGSVNGQSIDYGMDPDVVNDPRYKNLMDDALRAIPSLSLVTELANLFDPATGIYVNARGQGMAWERPVSVELLNPDGTKGFQIDAGLRIRGGYSRSGSNPKHALRLFFRPEYGTATLQYPLFEKEGVDEFECIDLRTSQNYSWSNEGGDRDTFVREVFSRDTQRDMRQPYTRSRYYHLYIDGQYWGLFQTQERSEAAWRPAGRRGVPRRMRARPAGRRRMRAPPPRPRAPSARSRGSRRSPRSGARCASRPRPASASGGATGARPPRSERSSPRARACRPRAPRRSPAAARWPPRSSARPGPLRSPPSSCHAPFFPPVRTASTRASASPRANSMVSRSPAASDSAVRTKVPSPARTRQ